MKENEGAFSDENLEKLSKHVPAALKTSDGKEKYVKFNAKLAKLKKFNLFHYLIMVGKLQGKTDKEIAETVGCCSKTVQEHRLKLQKADWLQNMFTDLMDLAPLFKESLKVLALNADALTTINFFKGMGVWSDKSEVTHKVSPADQKKKFEQSMKDILGIDTTKPVNRVKEHLDGHE